MNHTDNHLVSELLFLENEHASLKKFIDEAKTNFDIDQLALQRLKKRKLALKDRIAYIKVILYPDIIA